MSAQNILELFDSCKSEIISYERYDEIITYLSSTNTSSSLKNTVNDHDITLFKAPMKGILYKVQTIARLALQNPSFSHQDKIELYEKAQDLLKLSGSDLEIDDYFIPFELIYHKENRLSMDLSMKKISSMPFFKKLLSGSFQEAKQAGSITLTLPTPFSFEDFVNFFNYEKLITKEKLISVIFLADYFQEEAIFNYCLHKSYKFLDSEELYFLINEFFSTKSLASLIGAFVKSLFKESFSLEKIVSKLSDKDLLKLIEDQAIDLDFSNLTIDQKSFEAVTSLFSHVKSLSLAGCRNIQITHLPVSWKASLEYLDISNTYATSLPHHFPNLQEFRANNAEFFTEIENLDNCQKLRFIDISETQVNRAPSGCSSLKEFYAKKSCLHDVSQLNGLQALIKIDISRTSILCPPKGCTNLEEFIAEGTYLLSIDGFNELQALKIININETDIDDLSPLDGMLALKELHIEKTAALRAPIGCKNLERFYASTAKSLSDIHGLNGLQFLKEIHISHTSITEAPTGCLNLEQFSALYAQDLKDIDGLSNLHGLKFIDICNTKVEKAPSGLLNLRIFRAHDTKHLIDISSLSGLDYLQGIYISKSNVVKAPSACTNLETFYADSAENLSDISGLSGLQSLYHISICKTNVHSAPSGCSKLKIFNANSARNLSDISGLNNLNLLKEVDIGGTQVVYPTGCPNLNYPLSFK